MPSTSITFYQRTITQIRGNYVSIVNTGATKFKVCRINQDGKEMEQAELSPCNYKSFSKTSIDNGDYIFSGSGTADVIFSDKECDVLADTLKSVCRAYDETLSENVVNTNLLDNPDFTINQRGKTEYTGLSFKDSVDRWKLAPAGAVLTVNGDRSVSLKLTNTKYNTINAFSQDISDAARYCGRTVTLSTMLSEISGDIKVGIRCADENDNVLVDKYVAANDGTMTSVSITVPDKTRILTAVIRIAGMSDREQGFTALWCKLELGSAATSYIQAERGAELLKCQRYYQLHSSGNISELDLRPAMVNTPVVTKLSENKFSYESSL